MIYLIFSYVKASDDVITVRSPMAYDMHAWRLYLWFPMEQWTVSEALKASFSENILGYAHETLEQPDLPWYYTIQYKSIQY